MTTTKRDSVWAGELTHQLGVFAAASEDLGLIPNAYMAWCLITICNSNATVIRNPLQVSTGTRHVSGI